MNFQTINIDEISPVINENHNCDIVITYIDDYNFLQMISLLDLTDDEIHDLFLNNDFLDKYVESVERSKAYRGSVYKLRELNWNTLSFKDIYEEFEDRLTSSEKLLLQACKISNN